MGKSPFSKSALLASALLLAPAAALAQSAPEPPSVVGWLAQPSGTVWVEPAAGQPWQPALANQPLQSGEIVATAPNGETAIGVMSMRAVLGPSSEFAINDLSATGLSATETAGEVALDLSNLPSGATVAVATPRGTVQITEPGRYAIAAGAEGQPTMVTALGGGASIVNGASVEAVAPGQTATLINQPNGTIAVGIAPAQPDPLLRSVIASNAPEPQVAPPPEVAEMTGGLNLASYGTWSTVPSYGTVWFPSVAAGWVPYRDGRWVYVAPWGWTWVDADPWGFAPFHYGRWVEIGPRWGWVPVAPGISVSVGVPVYAPALVSFFGAGPGGFVGWVPLGPGEIYRPPYAVSPAYFRRVNVYNVRNIYRINIHQAVDNRLTINHFVNHGALTTVHASVLADESPVLRAYHRPPAQTMASLRALPQGVPVHPGPHRASASEGRPPGAPAPTRAPEPTRTVQARPTTPPGSPESPHAAEAHPPVSQPARRSGEPERSVGAHPSEPARQVAPAHQPEPYRSTTVHPPAPHVAHPPAEPPRPTNARPPEPPRPAAGRPAEPPRRAAPPYHPPEARAPARPPERPQHTQSRIRTPERRQG